MLNISRRWKRLRSRLPDTLGNLDSFKKIDEQRREQAKHRKKGDEKFHKARLYGKGRLEDIRAVPNENEEFHDDFYGEKPISVIKIVIWACLFTFLISSAWWWYFYRYMLN